MKKIINGKLYNTDTAEKIMGWTNGYGYGDGNYISEALHITKKGNYFLNVIGGAMTTHARQCGNEMGMGKSITLLTKKDAIVWLEEHNFTEELEEYFADEIEEG